MPGPGVQYLLYLVASGHRGERAAVGTCVERSWRWWRGSGTGVTSSGGGREAGVGGEVGKTGTWMN